MPDSPEIRLLACMDCGSVQPLSDFQGHPDDDQELIAATAKHESAGIRHTGKLFRVKESDWGLIAKREEILKQIKGRLDPNSTTGLDKDAYIMVDQFKSDAMDCFEQHHRNPACSDYHSREKRLVPDTAAERREAGMGSADTYDHHEGVRTIFLCDYCPVHSLVQQAARAKAGLYS